MGLAELRGEGEGRTEAEEGRSRCSWVFQSPSRTISGPASIDLVVPEDVSHPEGECHFFFLHFAMKFCSILKHVVGQWFFLSGFPTVLPALASLIKS